MTKLIINADDFGYGFLFNKKILELIESGLVTSTSVMVNRIEREQEDQVQGLISFSHKVSIGLHVDFETEDFKKEIEKQCEKFKQIFGFGPHFVDMHKTTYMEEGYPTIQEFCKREGLPCKNFGDRCEVIPGVITTKGPVFDGTHRSYEEIVAWLSQLEDDVYVIVFHPGYYDPKSKSSLNREREADAENIRRIGGVLSDYGIQLANFRDLLHKP